MNFKDFTRRKFLKTTSLLMAAPFIPVSFERKTTNPCYHFLRLAVPTGTLKRLLILLCNIIIKALNCAGCFMKWISPNALNSTARKIYRQRWL